MKLMAIVDLGTGWKLSGQLLASVASPSRRKSRMPTGYAAGWAPGPVWTLRSREESLASTGNQTPVVEPTVYRQIRNESMVQEICRRLSSHSLTTSHLHCISIYTEMSWNGLGKRLTSSTRGSVVG
jgi:hypothetical protein